MMSLAQPLPVELIDLIIDYIEVDVHFIDPVSHRRTHHCQCLRCDVREFDHNEDLLVFSQICSSFRKQAIPRLWSNYIVSMKRFSITERLLQRTEDKQIYFQHVKQLFLANIPSDAFNLGQGKSWSYWWIWGDENKPFGVHIHDVGNKGCSKEARVLSSLLRKCIKWVMEGKVRFIEILDEVTPHPLYWMGHLLPFWLCVTNPQSKSTSAEAISHFRQELNANKGDRKINFVSMLGLAAAGADASNDKLGFKSTKEEILDLINTIYFGAVALNPLVFIQVQNHVVNNYEPPKRELFINCNQRDFLPFWLQHDCQSPLLKFLQKENLKLEKIIELDTNKFRNVKDLVETTYNDGDDDSDWIRSNVFAKAEWKSYNSKDVQLVQEMMAKELFRSATLALRNDWRLREQVLAFYKNGWKNPMDENGTTSDTVNVDNIDNDDDNGCIVM